MLCLATFDITHMALYFEKTYRASGLNVKIIPMQRQVSATCGLACSYPCEDIDRVEAVVAEKAIEVAEYHSLAS